MIIEFLEINLVYRDDRYAPPYYREELPHHYASSSSSSNLMPREYSKLSTPLRRDGKLKTIHLKKNRRKDE